jgi:hypothetical protein
LTSLGNRVSSTGQKKKEGDDPMRGFVLLLVFLLVSAAAPLQLAAYSGTEQNNEQPQVQSPAPGYPGDHGVFEEERLFVRNAQGEELGEIIHFLADANTGQVAYALLDTGHSLEVDDLRLVPIAALLMEGEDIVLHMDAQQLADAPTPLPGQEPEEFHRRLSEYYGVAPYWEE